MKQRAEYQLSGRYIFHDSKDRTIYCPPFTDKAYVIRKDQFDTYTNWQLRGYIAALAGLLIIFFSKGQYLLAIVIAAVIYAISTFFYYRLFVSRLSRRNDFEKPRRQSYVASQISQYSSDELLKTALMALLLSGLFLFLIFFNHYTGVWLKVSLGLIIMFFAFGLLMAYCGVRKRKIEKENE